MTPEEAVERAEERIRSGHSIDPMDVANIASSVSRDGYVAGLKSAYKDMARLCEKHLGATAPSIVTTPSPDGKQEVLGEEYPKHHMFTTDAFGESAVTCLCGKFGVRYSTIEGKRYEEWAMERYNEHSKALPVAPDGPK